MNVLFALSALAQAPVPYDLDPAASTLQVRVFKDPDTVASGLAHDHVVVATGWSGSIAWGGPNGCAGTVRVPAASLVVDAPEARARLRMEEGPSEKQRAQVRESMLGKGQLDAGAHPWITFEATRCEAGLVRGKLSIHGVTREVAIPAVVSVEGGSLHAVGTFEARATDFGFEPYSAFLGAVRNRDEMTFQLDVRGRAKAPS